MAFLKIQEMGRNSLDHLEIYLKSEIDQQGNVIFRDCILGAANAYPDNFAKCCKDIDEVFNIESDNNDIKYIHYVQSFPPEDCKKMTREKCHELGVETAATLWIEFPVLIVTHFEKDRDDAEPCLWHNHFIVYNCAMVDGRRLNLSDSKFLAQKRFIAAQAEANGLTRKGLVLENGQIKECWVELERHRKLATENQKTELRFTISGALATAKTFKEFCDYLSQKNDTKTKEGYGQIVFFLGNYAWITAEDLGGAFSKEIIINTIKENNYKHYLENGTMEERFEYSRKYVKRQHIESKNQKERFEYYSKFIHKMYTGEDKN